MNYLLLLLATVTSLTSAMDMAELLKLNDELLTASKTGQLEEVKSLLEQGASVNHLQESTGSSSLAVAAQENKISVVEYLIEKGANVNVRDASGGTALFGPATNGFVKMATILVENGLDVNSVDSTGFTALHYASYRGRSSMVDYLVGLNGTVWYIASNSGLTPYMLACQDQSCVGKKDWVLGHISDVLHCDGMKGFEIDCSKTKRVPEKKLDEQENEEEQEEFEEETLEL